MSYQTPITVKQALERIHRHDYVLPAIQREFVWTPDQICRLFDSLLRGYPIGTFLFWEVTAETAERFVFYDVMREFHEAKNPHSPRLNDFVPQATTAILDGQQRLSALNIGLRGSYASKVPRKRLDPYPIKRLYLDLCHQAQPEDELLYRFEFRTSEEAAPPRLPDGSPDPAPTERWYLVADILAMKSLGDIFAFLQAEQLGNHPTVHEVLTTLYESVHQHGVVSFFVETEQSLAKVLDIFVRVNSGGTVLSKSDLLLSIATAQFTGRDAREAVHGLVDDLNGIAHGFNFSKDMVLKTGMILAGLPDPSFKVESFTRQNMQILDEAWDSIETSLRLAARLAASFGFSARTLSGNSVLIPVAHYLSVRGAGEAYLSPTNSDDHRRIKRWMLRSLIKPGVWGSGLDTLLKRLMGVVQQSGGQFPAEALEAEMARAGKDLNFGPALLADLAETPYKNKRVFALLSMLYPGIDVRNDFHEDHIFPRSRFTATRLVAAGIDPSDVSDYRDRVDRLPNLQLLEGSINIQKQKALPMDWARERYPEEQARQMWLSSHDLHDLPESITDFIPFYDARRQRLLERLEVLLGSNSGSAPLESTETGTVAYADAPANTLGASAAPERGASKRVFAKGLKDLSELGRLSPGDVLTGRHLGRTFQVVVGETGELIGPRGEIFTSPTRAACQLSGQASTNGWTFWHTEDDEPIGDLR